MDTILSITASLLVIGGTITSWSKRKELKEFFKSVFHWKRDLQVLFIDDEWQEFKLIETIDRHEHFVTRSISDLPTLTHESIKWADVCFVDIHGVGHMLNMQGQGKELATALKRQYPRKKIVLYSFDSQGNIFDPDLDILDWKIKKTHPVANVLERLEGWYNEL